MVAKVTHTLFGLRCFYKPAPTPNWPAVVCSNFLATDFSIKCGKNITTLPILDVTNDLTTSDVPRLFETDRLYPDFRTRGSKPHELFWTLHRAFDLQLVHDIQFLASPFRSCYR